MLSKNMNKHAINLLGILSFVPLMTVMYLLASPFFFADGFTLLPVAIMAWLSWIGVLLLFSIFLIQSPDFLVHQKILWLAALFLFGMLSNPVFWWMYFKSSDTTKNSNV